MSNNKKELDFYNDEERQAYILELISNGQIIRTHKDLIEIFENKGFYMSQSRVHRDFKKLKIHRDNGKYVIDEALEKIRIEKDLSAILIQTNSDTDFPSSFFTIKCDEGFEALIAKKIRETFPTLILGTIVGDGIITVFTESDETSKDLHTEITRIKNL